MLFIFAPLEWLLYAFFLGLFLLFLVAFPIPTIIVGAIIIWGVVQFAKAIPKEEGEEI